MKNNSLNEIVNLKISISNPVGGEVGNESVLLVVPNPTSTGSQTMNGVISVSSAKEVLDYGYTDTSSAYKACTVAFAQDPAPDTIYLINRKLTASGEGQAFENIALTLNRASETTDFYGIHITEFTSENDVEDCADWAESNEKLFGFEYTDYDAFPLTATEYYRTFAMFTGYADASEQPSNNAYGALALMVKCFGYDSGSETWANKTLSMITPSRLTTTQKEALEEKNVLTYRRYAGTNITIGGKTLAGEWIDVIRFRDWIKADMQTRIFSVIQSNRKIPYTDSGIALIESQILASLKAGQEVGGIAETEYDEGGNAISGYSVSVPLASSLTEAERKSRTLSKITWTARLAGAIHLVSIQGYMTF